MCNKTSSILKQHLHQSPLENHNPSRNQNPSCKHLSKSSIFFHLQLHFCLFERSHVLTPSSEIFRAIVLFRTLPVKGQTPGREKTWWRMKTRRFQNHRFVFTSSRKNKQGTSFIQNSIIPCRSISTPRTGIKLVLAILKVTARTENTLPCQTFSSSSWSMSLSGSH